MNLTQEIVDKISDEFQSTFIRLGQYRMMNMLGSKDDFDNVTRIIHKHFPEAKVEFTKISKLKSDYDIYIITIGE